MLGYLDMAFPQLGGVIVLVAEDHADTREMLRRGWPPVVPAFSA